MRKLLSPGSINCTNCSFGEVDGPHGVRHGAAHHVAHRPTDPGNHPEADPHVRELADAFVLCHLLCHIEAALLLVGVAFDASLVCGCVGLYDGPLRLGLLVDHANLLVNLGLANVGILPEVQLAEFPVDGVSFGPHDDGHEELRELDTVLGKVGR